MPRRHDASRVVRSPQPQGLLLGGQKRLTKLLGARAYRDRPHLVLEIDTAELLRRHSEEISLSPINSGATFTMNPAPRGPETFKRIPEHPEGMPVVELTVDYDVPDVADFTLSMSRWRGSEKLEEVCRRAAD